MGPVILETSDKIKLEIYPTSSMDKSYFNDSDNGHGIICKAISDLGQGDVFVDVGANIGYFSFLASKKVGRSGKVFSFEPSIREFKRLKHGKSLNHAENLDLYNIALSDTEGFVELSVSEYHTGTNQLVANSSKTSLVETIPCARLENIIPHKPIGLLKVDVEGAEMKILRGCAGLLEKKLIKQLVVEITPSYLERFGDTKEELYAFLANYEYVPTINSEAWQFDELFIQAI
jgi:FkbM family methyltransferase